MEVVQFIYNDQAIDFMPIGNDNVMVNATQMAKLFGKMPEAFTRNESTQKFIKECLKSENSRFLNINSELELIDSKQKTGTWMHRVLALKFAAWLDPRFELWVFYTMDKIILGHYKEIREATIEKLQLERELELKKQALIEKNPELAEIFELELKINAAEKKRIKSTKAQLLQLKLDLFPQTA